MATPARQPRSPQAPGWGGGRDAGKRLGRPRASAWEAAQRLRSPAASCDTEWLLSCAANMRHEEPGAPRNRRRAAAGPGLRMRSARRGPQLPPCPARAHRPAPRRDVRPPEVEPRGAVSDLRAGAAARAGFGRRRQRRTRCGQAGPEMASAGGGDCEGAAPEADRPHQRPFLIGVSGGTASGKVRGWAACRGLPRPLCPRLAGTLGVQLRPRSRAPRRPLPGVGGGCTEGLQRLGGQAWAGSQAGSGALASGFSKASRQPGPWAPAGPCRPYQCPTALLPSPALLSPA